MEETKKTELELALKREREAQENMKRFLEVAGIDVNQQPEPKQPDVLQSLKESKDMIGMFQELITHLMRGRESRKVSTCELTNAI